MLRIHYYKDRKIFDENCSPADIFNDDIQTAVAKYAAANIGRESQKGMKEKAMSGVFPGKVPLGYKNKRINQSSKNIKGDAIVVVDPDDRSVRSARRIFELRAQGLSYELIKDQVLKEKLLPPQKIKSFSKTGVEKILKNKFYLGKIKWKGEYYDCSQEIIIPKEHLDIVFNQRTGKHSYRPKGTLSNFLTCSTCGCSILYDPKKKTIKGTGEVRKYDYYHCSDGKRIHKHNKEKQVNVLESKILNQFEAVLDNFSISEETASEISKYLKTEFYKNAANQQDQVKSLQQAVKSVDQQEENLLDLLLNDTIDKETYQRRRNSLKCEKQKISDQISRIQFNYFEGFQLTSDKILELAKSIKSLWKSRNTEERVGLMKMVLSNQQLNGKVLETTLHRPFKVLGQMRDFKELKESGKKISDDSSKWCPGEDLNLHTVRH